MGARKGGSRERILDAAEQLFADQGFEATSTRQIAKQSGDTLGTLSYHFPSKEQLLVEVAARRFGTLAEMRRSLYEGFRSNRNGVPPSLEEVVRSVAEPLLRQAMTGGRAWSSYVTFICRLFYSSNPTHYDAVANVSDPMAQEIIGWLRSALPEANLRAIGFGYQFFIGCMVDSALQSERNRMERLTEGSCRWDDVDLICDRLVVFACAGFRAVVHSETSS